MTRIDLPCRWCELLAEQIENEDLPRWVVNYDHDRIWLNARARGHWFGAGCPRLWPASHLRALVHPQDRPELELAIDDALRRGAGFTWCIRALRPNGHYEWIKGFSWPVPCPGRSGQACANCPGAVYIATVEFSERTHGLEPFAQLKRGEALGL